VGAVRSLSVALSVALAAFMASLALARWAAGELADIAWADRRLEALDRRLAVSSRVGEAKGRVVNELIAGRLTLRQAADRFRELNAWLAPDGNEDLLGLFPVVTGEEAVWRNVLLWARAVAGVHLRRDPPPQNPLGIAARLEARGLPLRYIPAPWGDAVLTETDAPPDKLLTRWRDPSQIAFWQGTVYVEVDRGHGPTDDFGWGECGWRCGRLLFFGDPQMIRRIKAAVR
jgi:hypothetical protein